MYCARFKAIQINLQDERTVIYNEMSVELGLPELTSDSITFAVHDTNTYFRKEGSPHLNIEEITKMPNFLENSKITSKFPEISKYPFRWVANFPMRPKFRSEF